MELSKVETADPGGTLARLAAQAREMGIIEDFWVEGDECWLKKFDLTYSCSIEEAIATLQDVVAVVEERRANHR